jgi:hypothetical protein
LGNQKVFAGGGIVDVLADESLDLARQVGVQGLLQNCWYVPARFNFVFPERLDPRCTEVRVRLAAARLFDELFFLVLRVLQLVLFGLALTASSKGDSWSRCDRHRTICTGTGCGTTLQCLQEVRDLTADAVQQMKESGFEPTLVVETSPGNHQAWLNHGKILDKRTSTAAAKALAEKFGGDPGAADWRHFGRLSGFVYM